MSGDQNTPFNKAILDWDANAPRSIFFDDIYFASDGPAETDHVFLQGNNLSDRFANTDRFAIGELGFGTGLNFLAAWDLWNRTQKKEGAHLTFFSIEKFPLSSDDLQKAVTAWPQFKALSDRLIASAPPLTAGLHSIAISKDVSLTLAYDDVLSALKTMAGTVDAWFLDGFAPSKNPAMWQEDVFEEIAAHSAPKATFSTFTVAGKVRRGIEASGFSIERRPGFGRKREMLAGRIEKPLPKATAAPWFSLNKVKKIKPGANVVIIGGGIAGASLAYSLRRIGLKPRIADPAGIANGASGNPAGLIMPRLDLGETAPAQFFKAAYLYTIRLLMENTEEYFNPCGVTLKASSEEEKLRQQKIIDNDLLPEGWITATDEGLFFPQSGVIDPVAFCHSLAGDTEIIERACERVSHNGDFVEIEFDNGSHRQFDAAIIANAHAAKKLAPSRTLPVSGVAGQLDLFPKAPSIPSAIAAGPYIAPAPGSGVIAGATYKKIDGDQQPAPSNEASMENVAAVKALAPQLDLSNEAPSPRVSVRAQTPDRLPIAGPMPDWEAFGADYDGLRTGKQMAYGDATYQPNIWILNGLGSRGLVTAPYCAILIASMMTGQPVAATKPVLNAIHPGRFFIRALKRGET